MIDLRGKVALVTGSARRVGKAIALELAAQGMNLVIHHRNSDAEATATAEAVRALGVQAHVIKADLRHSESIARLFAETDAHYEQLDVLVNSASVFKTGDIAEISPEEWREVLDINLTAPLLCSQHAARLMRRNANGEGGTIINITDLSAFRPWKTYPHHSVSKAALVSLTQVLAVSLAPQIRVNAVAPGPVLRDEGNSPEKWEKIGQRLPLKRTGDPRDIGRAVAFLASQPFITGEILRVDGGEWLMWNG